MQQDNGPTQNKQPPIQSRFIGQHTLNDLLAPKPPPAEPVVFVRDPPQQKPPAQKAAPQKPAPPKTPQKETVQEQAPVWHQYQFDTSKFMPQAAQPATGNAFATTRSSFAVSPLPYIVNQQEALIGLGFDVGADGANGFMNDPTRRALQDFADKSGVDADNVHDVTQVLIDTYQKSSAEAEGYSNRWQTILPVDVYAIRTASENKGVSFGYMMELANTESSFKANAKATETSATGHFQMIDRTWLSLVSMHGHKYGLGDYQKHIDMSKGDRHEIDDKALRKELLDLRKDPHISAALAVELAIENRANMVARTGNPNITRTEEYMAHFMGAAKAVTFLREMEKNPSGIAAAAFPEESNTNPHVFYKDGENKTEPRTMEEVFTHLDNKFDTGRFDKKQTVTMANNKSGPQAPTM